jgi:hypothetical protein
MQTLVVGAPLVLLTWTAITAAVWHFAGALPALVALVALPFLADCDFALRDRAARATARLRAYRRFRREPSLQRELTTAIAAARDEAADLERTLLPGQPARA